MPSKSKRAASRQAEVRRRRRKTKGQSQEFDPGPSESTEAAAAPRPVDEAVARPEAAMGVPAPQAGVRLPRRSRPRGSVEPPLVYGYLSSELRRIGVLTALMVAALAVLTVFLRS